MTLPRLTAAALALPVTLFLNEDNSRVTDIVSAPARAAICPPDNPDARRVVNKFLKAPELASFRSEVGIGMVDTSTVRVLADSTDSATCQRLDTDVVLPSSPPRRHAYYEAGGFFFIAMSRGQGLGTSFAPFIVLDSALTVRLSLGM